MVGLKVVEAVVRKIENIEKVQTSHGEMLTTQETATKGNAEKIDDLKRLAAVEEKMSKMDNDAATIRLTNAVVREVQLIERNDTNFMVWNIPESTEEAVEDRKSYDLNRVKDLLKELKMEDVVMKNRG